ncbi:MAG: hypothetical protein ACE5IZ_06305 [Dehalococcoidia bacterium]
MDEPTREDWHQLYQAAVQFRDTAPWHWLTDDDLFAVENPADGQMGYCVVMGSGGLEFGLAVFQGDDGFDSYRRLLLGEAEPESLEGAARLRSLSVTFGDRQYLQKRDRDTIKALGLRFRGRNAWPLFRSQRPGYSPWFLVREEVLFLNIVLRQAVRVAEAVRRGDIDLIEGSNPDQVLTFQFREGEWQTAWRGLPEEPEPELPAPVDEVRLRRLAAEKGYSRDAWEVDLFFVPAVIDDGKGRPYHPLALLAFTDQGLVAGLSVLDPWATPDQHQEEFVQVLEKAPALPREIRVPREETARTVRPASQCLDIPVRVGDTSLLDVMREELLEQLGR